MKYVIAVLACIGNMAVAAALLSGLQGGGSTLQEGAKMVVDIITIFAGVIDVTVVNYLIWKKAV